MGIEQLRADQLGPKRGRIQYLITGQASSAAAQTLLLATAPSTFNSLPKRSADSFVREQASEDGSGNGDYIGTMPYGTSGSSPLADLEVGDTRILVNTLGGSVSVTQSLNTVNTYGDAEDHGGAIGVDAAGNINGTDIATGGLSFTIVKIVASTDLTTAYLNDVLSLSTPNPHTNNAVFSHTDTDGRAVSLSTGEGLFLGMTNSPRGNSEDELRFEFKGSANLTDALPGSPWTVVKGGWEHLWVRYKPAVDGAANKLVAEPASAYVEQVYESGNYGLLSL